MYPHRIRLRGPWECEPLARLVRHADDRLELVAEGLPPKMRMTMPARWRDAGLTDFAGRVRLRRHFGYPGRIDAHERVWLTLVGLDTSADIRLNGVSVGHCGPGTNRDVALDVTHLLRQRNELCIDVEDETGAGGLWGEVALEIRCTAYLRHVRAWRGESDGQAMLHLSGELVGTCDGPLELYALAERTNVFYAPLTAGQSFALTATDLPPAALTATTLRVELVCVAVVWYAVEVPLELPVNP